MTGTDLYELATEALQGLAINETLFYSYLNIARVTAELKRSWRRLRKLDSTASVTSATTYATLIALPTDWRRYVPARRAMSQQLISPVQLVDASGNVCFNLQEVAFTELQQYKDTCGYYAVDLVNQKLRITGTWAATYTIHQHYQYDPGDIAAGSSWPFEEATYSRMLVHDALAMYELGADYDDVNARMGNANAAIAARTLGIMVKWDDSLTQGPMA